MIYDEACTLPTGQQLIYDEACTLHTGQQPPHPAPLRHSQRLICYELCALPMVSSRPS